MADKNIGALPSAPSVNDDALLAVEQQGIAMKMTGAQFRAFGETAARKVAQATASPYAQAAAASASSAATSATAAEKARTGAETAKAAAETAKSAAKSSETSAAASANSAKQYSGKPPKIQDGTWWIWNAAKQKYEDTGEYAQGNVLFATFAIDVATGLLIMTTPDEYHGPEFHLVDGMLEVSIRA